MSVSVKCVFVCASVFACECVFVFVCVCVCLCVRVRVRICVCMVRARLCACECVRTRACLPLCRIFNCTCFIYIYNSYIFSSTAFPSLVLQHLELPHFLEVKTVKELSRVSTSAQIVVVNYIENHFNCQACNRWGKLKLVIWM